MAGGLISHFRAVLMVSLVNAEQMGEGTPAPLGIAVGQTCMRVQRIQGLPSRWYSMVPSAHEDSLRHYCIHKDDSVGQTDKGKSAYLLLRLLEHSWRQKSDKGLAPPPHPSHLCHPD